MGDFTILSLDSLVGGMPEIMDPGDWSFWETEGIQAVSRLVVFFQISSDYGSFVHYNEHSVILLGERRFRGELEIQGGADPQGQVKILA